MRPLPVLLLLQVLACGKDPGPASPPADTDTDTFDDTREDCAVQVPERQLLWGDLHVHTAYSFDAWVYDVRATPDDATRFAKGEALAIPPLDADGNGTATLQLERPLDFVAITDHAGLLGETQGCVQPDSAAYDTEFCVGYRAADAQSIRDIATILASEEPEHHEEICTDFDCEQATLDAWQDMQQTAEAHYDRTSACSFTTFVGYEWTSARGVSNYHRNVIFRSATVPTAPATVFDEPRPEDLWRALDRDCIAVEGCDVLAIPHNSDMSNGQQFVPDWDWAETEAEGAALRARMEPLIEIYQHKGDAECRNDQWGILAATDEACAFEKQRAEGATDCEDGVGNGGMAGFGCVSRLDYLRGILLEGLVEEQRLGVNPYALGVIASTDTHSGTPGYVREDAWLGHLGGFEDDPEERLAAPADVPGGYPNSPGGLVGAWSVSNDRDALFDAFRAREVMGTSGPRIAVRFFGGELADDLCDAADLVAQADEHGVPMGGRLTGQEAPTFVVHALMDPGTTETPGTELQRAQIVKGWLDADGERHIEVIDVAGGDNEATVDPDTCETSGSGAAELCGTWTDPDWDAAQPAFYYARVLENPVCRWSTRDCNTLGEGGGERPEVCDDGTLAETIQERAWTSPIFHSP